MWKVLFDELVAWQASICRFSSYTNRLVADLPLVGTERQKRTEKGKNRGRENQTERTNGSERERERVTCGDNTCRSDKLCHNSVSDDDAWPQDGGQNFAEV